MKVTLKLFILIFTVAIWHPETSLCQSPEDNVREKMLTAFEAVAEAERKGGDVSRLVNDLNEALRLLEAGGKSNLIVAESKIEYVLAATTEVELQGIFLTRKHRITKGAIIGTVTLFAILMWWLGPKVFWSMWLYSKREWRVHG